jgi:hypothetical protein
MSSEYSISKCNGGWAIAVDGVIVLVCKRKAVAQRIVRDVTTCNAVAAIDTDCVVRPASPRDGVEPITPAET